MVDDVSYFNVNVLDSFKIQRQFTALPYRQHWDNTKLNNKPTDFIANLSKNTPPSYQVLQGGPKKTVINIEGPPNFYLLSKCNAIPQRHSLNLFLQVPEKFLGIGNILFAQEQILSEYPIKFRAFPNLTLIFGLENGARSQEI